MFHMELSLKKNTMTEGKLRHSELSIVVHMNTQSKKINSDGSLNAKKTINLRDLQMTVFLYDF